MMNLIPFALSLLLGTDDPATAKLKVENAEIKARLEENEAQLAKVHQAGKELKAEADRNKAKLDAPPPGLLERGETYLGALMLAAAGWLKAYLARLMADFWEFKRRLDATVLATDKLVPQIKIIADALTKAGNTPELGEPMKSTCKDAGAALRILADAALLITNPPKGELIWPPSIAN